MASTDADNDPGDPRPDGEPGGGRGGEEGEALPRRDPNAAPLPPIRDYALIGDCHGAALVARDGSVDWTTLHRFDADPVHCRLVDAGRGGHLAVRPTAAFEVERAYVDDTNVLRTVFTTATGRVALTDFMPVGRTLGAAVHDYVSLAATGWLVRRIEVLEGEVELGIDWRPSVDFAASRPTLERGEGRVGIGAGAPTLFADLDFALDADRATARVVLRTGDAPLDLVLADSWVEGERPQDRVGDLLCVTLAFWTEWIEYCRYDGPHAGAMRRGALVLKLLTWAKGGSVVAAPTTSLPETIGGERNWDYRYCWVRDTSLTLYALSVLGYSGEVRRFQEWLADCCTRSLPEVRPMYAIDGSLDIAETELDHLAGYAGSTPVHRGNGAVGQRQIDAYGHVLDLALVYERLGGEIDEQYRRLLGAVAAFVEAHWDESGAGMWEMRDGERDHVHDRTMCWVAMDRAAILLDEPRYRILADRIAGEIRERGVSAEDGALEQSYQGGTDTAPLLAPMLGLELDDATLAATLERVEAKLGRGKHFARYAGDDGLDGEEGAFLLCTSWVADVELALGRTDAARARIEGLLNEANDVGLFAEEIDAGTGAFLGNFPQALTHLGVLMNLVHLQLVEEGGTEAIAGTYADRAERVVGASFGLEGLLASAMRSGTVHRVTSSTASMLAWP